jgi:hypothetical protein
MVNVALPVLLPAAAAAAAMSEMIPMMNTTWQL